jgi:excinuclease ABC subunit A
MRYLPQKLISIKGAEGNNLKKINVDIPIGLMTCITGVSGSGKSTIIQGYCQ